MLSARRRPVNAEVPGGITGRREPQRQIETR